MTGEERARFGFMCGRMSGKSAAIAAWVEWMRRRGKRPGVLGPLPEGRHGTRLTVYDPYPPDDQGTLEWRERWRKK